MSLKQKVHDFVHHTGRYPNKKLGQNFLIDANILPKIVSEADIEPVDLVIEIGAGLGFLTSEIVGVARKTVAIEIDSFLCHTLYQQFSSIPDFTLIEDDVLQLNLSHLFLGYDRKNVKIIGNLPYYASTPIIWKLLKYNQHIGCCVLMFQTEVARRIVASPGNKDYGALSIGIDYYAKAEIVLHLSPNQFYPVPKVSSSLVKLTLRPQPKVLVKDEVLFFQLIRSAFQFRRKMLRNAIEHGCINLDMEQMNQVFATLKIDSNRRGETLYISEFAEIANTVTETTN